MKTTWKAILLSSILYMILPSCNNQQSSENGSNIPSRSDTTTAQTKDTIANHNTITDTGKTVSADWLLVPGVSAGKTKINENADSVYQRLGTPDGGDAAMQKAVAIWFAHHDTTAYSTAIYTARNTDSPAIASVLQIRVTSPAFKTTEGIHTTSSLQEIQHVFSVENTEQYKDAGTVYTVYDSDKGIAFEMAPDEKCIAIIIHKSGDIGEGTYLKFRTTNKFVNRKANK